MRRIIITTLLVLVGFAGVASADRPHVRDQRGGVYVAPSRNYRYERPRYQRYERPRYVYRNNPRYVRPTYRYVRRPIYVQRPAITFRYYNYYQRPALVAENYAAMPGYFWVAGQWNWNGYEWIWTPGHYEPDPNYSGYYSNTYDSTYYQQNPYYDPSYTY